MSAKDFFKELDPLCQWKEDEMALRDKVLSEPSTKDPFEMKGLLDDSH